jgi:hypothetical protein
MLVSPQIMLKCLDFGCDDLSQDAVAENILSRVSLRNPDGLSHAWKRKLAVSTAQFMGRHRGAWDAALSLLENPLKAAIPSSELEPWRKYINNIPNEILIRKQCADDSLVLDSRTVDPTALIETIYSVASWAEASRIVTKCVLLRPDRKEKFLRAFLDRSHARRAAFLRAPFAVNSACLELIGANASLDDAESVAASCGVKGRALLAPLDACNRITGAAQHPVRGIECFNHALHCARQGDWVRAIAALSGSHQFDIAIPLVHYCMACDLLQSSHLTPPLKWAMKGSLSDEILLQRSPSDPLSLEALVLGLAVNHRMSLAEKILGNASSETQAAISWRTMSLLRLMRDDIVTVAERHMAMYQSWSLTRKAFSRCIVARRRIFMNNLSAPALELARACGLQERIVAFQGCTKEIPAQQLHRFLERIATDDPSVRLSSAEAGYAAKLLLRDSAGCIETANHVKGLLRLICSSSSSEGHEELRIRREIARWAATGRLQCHQNILCLTVLEFICRFRYVTTYFVEEVARPLPFGDILESSKAKVLCAWAFAHRGEWERAVAYLTSTSPLRVGICDVGYQGVLKVLTALILCPLPVAQQLVHHISAIHAGDATFAEGCEIIDEIATRGESKILLRVIQSNRSPRWKLWCLNTAMTLYCSKDQFTPIIRLLQRKMCTDDINMSGMMRLVRVLPWDQGLAIASDLARRTSAVEPSLLVVPLLRCSNIPDDVRCRVAEFSKRKNIPCAAEVAELLSTQRVNHRSSLLSTLQVLLRRLPEQDLAPLIFRKTYEKLSSASLVSESRADGRLSSQARFVFNLCCEKFPYLARSARRDVPSLLQVIPSEVCDANAYSSVLINYVFQRISRQCKYPAPAVTASHALAQVAFRTPMLWTTALYFYRLLKHPTDDERRCLLRTLRHTTLPTLKFLVLYLDKFATPHPRLIVDALGAHAAQLPQCVADRLERYLLEKTGGVVTAASIERALAVVHDQGSDDAHSFPWKRALRLLSIAADANVIPSWETIRETVVVPLARFKNVDEHVWRKALLVSTKFGGPDGPHPTGSTRP